MFVKKRKKLMTSLNKLVQNLIGKLGYEIRKKVDANQMVPTDINSEYANIIHNVKPFTMTSFERLNALLSAVDYVCDNKIEGCYVECGVWRGGSTMAAALRFIDRQESQRKLYLYDTFEGMPAPTTYDFSSRSGHAAKKFEQTKITEDSSSWCFADIEDVKTNLATTNYPYKNMNFIKGRVEDTIPANAPDKIAILRLDTDWYASTKHEIENLYPRLVNGGVLIIDDYGHWEGCRKAIDEYFLENNKQTPLLARVDYTGRIGVKF